MNKKIVNLLLLAILFCLSISLSFFNTSISKAQTTNSAKPSPTVSPSPKPTIADDEGEIFINEELVNLNVRVVDRNNRPVSTLAQNDFQIFEDKVLQSISYFSKAEVPTSYSLVIDNSGSMRFQLEKVIEASKIIINTNKPEDATSVIRFVSSDKIEILEEFTSDKSELEDALESMYIEGGQTSIIDAIYLAAERVDEYDKNSGSNDRKRRALILVSDGEDRSSFYKEAQLFDLLRESDVQIYTIGFINDLESEGGFIRKSPQTQAKNFLTKLSTETGGKAYFPNSLAELNGIAADIANELRTQYLISYTPTDDRKDGKVRNIKVVVKDGPKSEKRIALTRTGRVAEKDSNTPPTLQNKNK